MTRVGDNAFLDCSALAELDLPASVVSIGETAFDNCLKLSSLNLRAVTPPATWFESFASPVCAHVSLYVPRESVGAYRSAKTWRLFRHIQALR